MKDLFRRIFPAVSQFSYADYHGDFVRNAPAWILQSAGAAHDCVRRLPGFERTCAAMVDRAPECWHNPELYPPLFHLLGARDNDDRLIRRWRALQAHLGLAPVAPDMFTHSYFRLQGPQPATFQLEDGVIREVRDAILIDEPGLPLVYQPTPALFNDVIVKGIAYSGAALPFSRDHMRYAIHDAMRVLADYDATLHAGFIEAVGTIAITGDWRPGDRIGYSTASVFPGAIFTSLCTDSAPLLVESFIHEYYHQRLWLWWLIEQPSDMPGADMVMTSPVSGQQRAVRVMMQALLIYISLADYYRWAETAFPEDGEWIERRWRGLSAGARQLTAALQGELCGRTHSQRFVSAIAEHLP